MTQMYFVSCSFIVVYIPWHFRACNQIRISNDAWTRILIKVNSNSWNIKSSDSARLYTRKQDVLIEDLKLQLHLIENISSARTTVLLSLPAKFRLFHAKIGLHSYLSRK